MVDIAQLVEHQIVALRVVGSSPTIHPIFFQNSHFKILAFEKKQVYSNLYIMSGRSAIGSALALGARGCQFESGRPDHFFKPYFSLRILIIYIHVFHDLSSASID